MFARSSPPIGKRGRGREPVRARDIGGDAYGTGRSSQVVEVHRSAGVVEAGSKRRAVNLWHADEGRVPAGLEPTRTSDPGIEALLATSTSGITSGTTAGEVCRDVFEFTISEVGSTRHCGGGRTCPTTYGPLRAEVRASPLIGSG